MVNSKILNQEIQDLNFDPTLTQKSGEIDLPVFNLELLAPIFLLHITYSYVKLRLHGGIGIQQF